MENRIFFALKKLIRASPEYTNSSYSVSSDKIQDSDIFVIFVLS